MMRISRKARTELSWILIFLGSLSLLYALVFGDAGYLQIRKYRQELQSLRQENLQLRRQYQEYSLQIGKLKNDPSEIERIARENYNYARPGDIIVRIPE